MKLYKLRVQDLKSELKKRGLQTEGFKDELVLRLHEAMANEGLDPEIHDFGMATTELIGKEKTEDIETQAVEEIAPVASKSVGAPNVDMSQFMVLLTQMMAQQHGELKLSNQEMKQEMNQMMAQQHTEMKQDMAQQIGDLKESNDRITQRLDEKFLDLSTTIDRKVEQLHGEIQDVKTEIQTEVESVKTQVEQKLYTEVQRLEKELRDIKKSETTTQVVQTSSKFNLKPPTFDGTTSFAIFKFQFETASVQNQWNEEHQVAALIVALKGEAAETLQTIPENERRGYGEIIKALERKYGSDHKREIYRMELKGRSQKAGETLQEFASAVERLAHLAHASTSSEFMERIKIDAFIDGIRDTETRRAVILTPKATFAETIACALINETAQTLIKPAINKIRRVEIDTSSNTEQPTYRSSTSGKIRCWICDKLGHISRDCYRNKGKRGKSPSPMVRRSSGDQVVANREAQVTTESLNINESA